MKPKPLKKDAVDLLKAVADKQAALTCVHPHLKFERYGAILECIDCNLHWFVAKGSKMPDGSFGYEMPDFTYGNPRISDSEMRHSPYEAQRTAPRK